MKTDNAAPKRKRGRYYKKQKVKPKLIANRTKPNEGFIQTKLMVGDGSKVMGGFFKYQPPSCCKRLTKEEIEELNK